MDGWMDGLMDELMDGKACARKILGIQPTQRQKTFRNIHNKMNLSVFAANQLTMKRLQFYLINL